MQILMLCICTVHTAHTHIHVLANQMSNKGITKGSTAFDA